MMKPMEQPRKVHPNFKDALRYGLLSDYGYQEPPRKWWLFFWPRKLTYGFIITETCIIRESIELEGNLYQPKGVKLITAGGRPLSINMDGRYMIYGALSFQKGLVPL